MRVKNRSAHLADVRAAGEELEEEDAAEVAAAARHEDAAPAEEADDVRLGPVPVLVRPLGDDDHVVLVVVPVAHLDSGGYSIVRCQISYFTLRSCVLFCQLQLGRCVGPTPQTGLPWRSWNNRIRQFSLDLEVHLLFRSGGQAQCCQFTAFYRVASRTNQDNFILYSTKLIPRVGTYGSMPFKVYHLISLFAQVAMQNMRISISVFSAKRAHRTACACSMNASCIFATRLVHGGSAAACDLVNCKPFLLLKSMHLPCSPPGGHFSGFPGVANCQKSPRRSNPI